MVRERDAHERITEAPDEGASPVYDKATRTLLEQAGELVIGGRLVKAPVKVDKEKADG